MDKKMARRQMIELGRKMMMEDDSMGLEELLKDKKAPVEKVVVAADSKEGLKKGLSKAEQILNMRSELLGLKDEEECDVCEPEEMEEESSEESMEMPEKSEEDEEEMIPGKRK
jgi:hypothetical protein